VTGQQTRFTRNTSNQLMSWVMLRLYFGKMLNLLGIPATIRKCNYRSEAVGVTVKVQHRDLFTVVTVNGLDVYFSRITGNIDGVGVSQAAYCTAALAQESTDLGELFATPPPQPRMQKMLDCSD
jgi:hypothetical protein